MRASGVVRGGVSYRREGAVGVVRLERPASLNALSVAMGEAFAAAVAEARADPGLRAVVVGGEGRAFSAGGDLAFLEARARDAPAANASEMRRYYDRFLAVRRLPVPTLAALHGPAVGAGLCLALAWYARPPGPRPRRLSLLSAATCASSTPTPSSASTLAASASMRDWDRRISCRLSLATRRPATCC